MQIEKGEAAQATSWLFWQGLVRGDYLIALCAERGRGGVPRLVMKETVPREAEIM